MSAVDQFRLFFDDAAIFPPHREPLDRAVHDHLDRKNKPVARLVGPLVLPFNQLVEAADYTGDEVLEVIAIITTDEFDVLRTNFHALPNIKIVSVEVKFPSTPPADNSTWLANLRALAAERASISVFMELPASVFTEDIAHKLRAMRAGLKFRTGGTKQEEFPSANELADVLTTAVHAAVPIKLAAGIKQAIRHSDAKTGLAHFGFLNVAAAIAELRAGHGRDAALKAINSNEEQILAHTVETSETWRDSFRSFATTDVMEPIETLIDLGLLAEDDIRP